MTQIAPYGLNFPMTSSQTAHIERATLAAVMPEAVEELPGWLLPFDTSTVGRAISAVPLSHTFDQDAANLVSQIEARYLAHGLQAAFRLPDMPEAAWAALFLGGGL